MLSFTVQIVNFCFLTLAHSDSSGLFCNLHLTGHPSGLYNPSESQILNPKFHVSNICLEELLVIISISEFP